MPKGQLSRVPWQGNAWMPFTFQPALQVLQQPHKHSHSLMLATHTELAHAKYIRILKVSFHCAVQWSQVLYSQEAINQHNILRDKCTLKLKLI